MQEKSEITCEQKYPFHPRTIEWFSQRIKGKNLGNHSI